MCDLSDAAPDAARVPLPPDPDVLTPRPGTWQSPGDDVSSCQEPRRRPRWSLDWPRQRLATDCEGGQPKTPKKATST